MKRFYILIRVIRVSVLRSLAYLTIKFFTYLVVNFSHWKCLNLTVIVYWVEETGCAVIHGRPCQGKTPDTKEKDLVIRVEGIQGFQRSLGKLFCRKKIFCDSRHCFKRIGHCCPADVLWMSDIVPEKVFIMELTAGPATECARVILGLLSQDWMEQALQNFPSCVIWQTVCVCVYVGACVCTCAYTYKKAKGWPLSLSPPNSFGCFGILFRPYLPLLLKTGRWVLAPDCSWISKFQHQSKQRTHKVRRCRESRRGTHVCQVW